MSIFSSVSDYFGSSTKHANKASTHLSNAGSAASAGAASVGKIANIVNSGESSFYNEACDIGQKTIFTAGSIIGANSLVQFANWGASFFGGSQAASVAAQATTYAAKSLVQLPIGSMSFLMAGSIIATHPKESFEAVKEFGKAVYNFVEAGVELTEAVAEAAITLGLKGIELADMSIDELVKSSAIAQDEMINFSSALASDAHDILLGKDDVSLGGDWDVVFDVSDII